MAWIHVGRSTLTQEVQIDHPRSRPSLTNHVRSTLIHKYKRQPLIGIRERTSHIQLALIPLNFNLSFERIKSGNPLPDLDLSIGAGNEEASDEAHNSIRPDAHFRHSSLRVGQPYVSKIGPSCIDLSSTA